MKCQHCERQIEMKTGYALLHISRPGTSPTDLYFCIGCWKLALEGMA